METTKTGKFIFTKAKSFKAEYGTITPNPKSSYIKISGHHQLIDSDMDLESAIRRLKIDLRRFIYNISQELFDGLIPNRTYFDIEYTDTCITKMNYFAVNIDLFFDSSIILKSKEVQDKHQVFSELIVEYLQENRLFNFIPSA